MRLFIAIAVPHQLYRYCQQLQSRYPDLKMTREFHLTLQFLGNEIDDEQSIVGALSKIMFKPFDIEMGDAKPFGHPADPRGVWIECKESDKLIRLADQIRKAMGELGYQSDKPFRAHITLGRYKQAPRKKPEKIKGEPHVFTVDKFYLIESILLPEGPVYKTVAKFPE
ncbi:RNA 2',3'-cyclic phosphodiesterase [Candidatus Peregrinibacteria bacterium]|nr:RNA 2',3'-cyclic phosphodiesterase [Candidatus Peregrinibacteria bacterium]